LFLQTPNFIWSEEYQVSLMSKHFQAFDELRERGFFIGEFIWNFADFKTAQSKFPIWCWRHHSFPPFAAYTRVGGNKKGIFTRNRQPKASAHHLRKRYWALAAQLYNASMPHDLYDYVARPVVVHDEL
jgi:beta-glucuronidase